MVKKILRLFSQILLELGEMKKILSYNDLRKGQYSLEQYIINIPQKEQMLHIVNKPIHPWNATGL